MDNEVFSNESIGKLANSSFVSFKLQMDSSKITRNYSTMAKNFTAMLKSTYKIKSLPTLIFLSPEGELVMKIEGYRSKMEFLSDLNKVLSLDSNYYTKITAFRERRLNLDSLEKLALTAQKNDIRDVLVKIAEAYCERAVADKLTIEKQSKIGLELLLNFDVDIPYNYLKLIANNELFIDSTFKNKGRTRVFLTERIYLKKINRQIEKAIASKSQPKIHDQIDEISKDFNFSISDEIFLNAMAYYSLQIKNDKNYTRYICDKIDKYSSKYLTGMPLVLVLNNTAFDIFHKSSNKNELNRAVRWCDQALSLVPENESSAILDTKSNLIYKLGDKKQAISLEKKAIYIQEGYSEAKANLSKMEKGIRTW